MPLDDLANREVFADVLPGVPERLLDAEGDSPVRRIDFEHDGVNNLADCEQVSGMAHPAGPRHLRNMYQAFDAGFKLDERAKVFQQFDRTFTPVADLEFFRRSASTGPA